MATFDLNNAKGFFKDIVKSNFDELNAIDSTINSGELSVKNSLKVIKQINLALTLNHVADKVANKLGGIKAVDVTKIASENSFPQVDILRQFCNDIKHECKQCHFADGADYDYRFVDKSGAEHSLGDILEKVYVYWGKYFADEISL